MKSISREFSNKWQNMLNNYIISRDIFVNYNVQVGTTGSRTNMTQAQSKISFHQISKLQILLHRYCKCDTRVTYKFEPIQYSIVKYNETNIYLLVSNQLLIAN